MVDAADPSFRRQIAAVEEVLEGILDHPRPTTLVFNKCDLLADPDQALGLRVEYPGSFVVSAKTGEGFAALRGFVWAEAAARAGRKAS